MYLLSADILLGIGGGGCLIYLIREVLYIIDYFLVSSFSRWGRLIHSTPFVFLTNTRKVRVWNTGKFN